MRIIGRLLWTLLGVAMLYAAAALAGGFIPVNGAWEPAWAGKRIYVVDNGVHTDLVLPAREFADIVRPQHFGAGVEAAQGYLMFGWGDRDFYVNTPTWRETNPFRILGALAGLGSTVLHVTHTRAPGPASNVRALNLRPEEYRKLVRYVRGTFASGRVVRGYGDRDAFYPAKGAYNAIRTCNEWTARGLRQAGVRMGAWAPFSWGVMQWL